MRKIAQLVPRCRRHLALGVLNPLLVKQRAGLVKRDGTELHVAIAAAGVADPQAHFALRRAVEKPRQVGTRPNRLAVDAQDNLAGENLRFHVISRAAGDDVMYLATGAR